MKMKGINTIGDIKLVGITIEGVMESTSLKRLTLKDTEGNTFEIIAEYGTRAYIKAPPEKKDVWKLVGTVLGLKVEETFDDEFTAKQAFSKIEGSPDTTAKLEKIEVEVQ